LSIYYDGESFKQCIYFQKCTYVFTMRTYQVRGSSNFPRQVTRAFRTHKLTAKESLECVIQETPSVDTTYSSSNMQ
jgi:hypothetical protein